jgi:carbonic anhydrase
MQPFEKLLLENKAWAQEKKARDPEFFRKITQERTPDFLWIGCSDSRVHADEITNTEPGEIFVHRNIANLVVNTDMNLLSALQYVVDLVKVKHVIVCGHYGCGGIRAAMRKARPDELMINKWLKHIKDVYRLHRDEINALDSDEARLNRLVEINVVEQVHNLAQTSIIQQAWRAGQEIQLHGWIYGASDGVIREFARLDASSPIDPIYEYDPDWLKPSPV